jgi:two-component system, chemotaxis family, protein-glutamate methylesterase/glutaminase
MMMLALAIVARCEIFELDPGTLEPAGDQSNRALNPREGGSTQTHDVMAIGASSAGIEPLKSMLRDLPRDLRAAIFAAVHRSPGSSGDLAQVLGQGSRLPVVLPKDGAPTKPGVVYLAPPDHHLLVRSGKVLVRRGPKENRMRPAADSLLRSAAVSYGPRVIGVVLAGAMDDGTAGLLAVKRQGGVAVVQDPEDAVVPYMPLNALRHVEVDHRASAAELGPLLERLVREPVPPGEPPPVPPVMMLETKITALEVRIMEDMNAVGVPAGISCPECGGPLWQVKGEELHRFRCHTGHAYSTESLGGDQARGIEASLWNALRAMKEKAVVLRQLSARARREGREEEARLYEDRINHLSEHVESIERMLSTDGSD